MPPRLFVPFLLCAWVFSVTAPSLLCVAMEDACLLVALGEGEEEPGEGPKKDLSEEPLTPPDIWQPAFCFSPVGTHLPGVSRAPQDIIREIVPPPPEQEAVS